MRLHHGAAPNLPEAYAQAMDGILRIGPIRRLVRNGGLHSEPVIVADVTTRSALGRYRDAARRRTAFDPAGRAPILSHQGQVLGTFALYSDSVREPIEAEWRLIDVATKIAGIAIERKLAEDRIQFMATHDALTGLPNRTCCKERLTRAI